MKGQVLLVLLNVEKIWNINRLCHYDPLLLCDDGQRNLVVGGEALALGH